MKPWAVHVYSILTTVVFLTSVLHLKAGLLQLVLASLVTWLLVRQGRGLADEAKKDAKSGKGRWETVMVLDPADPEHKHLIEKRVHHEEYEGQDLWMGKLLPTHRGIS